MNLSPETIPIERYIAIDSHKHYVMVGGMNQQREWILRPRKVQMPRFRDWAARNLKPGDALVLETTANVWDIYDIVAPLVGKTVVANAYKVRQIAEARVKTDKADVRRLITLLIADIVPEVLGAAHAGARTAFVDLFPLAFGQANHDVEEPPAQRHPALQS